jgi:hypothetical protein
MQQKNYMSFSKKTVKYHERTEYYLYYSVSNLIFILSYMYYIL